MVMQSRVFADCTDPAYQWSEVFGASSNERPLNVSIGPNGEMCIVGWFGCFDDTNYQCPSGPGTYEVDFNPVGFDVHTSQGKRDGFISKYDSDGNYVWTKTGGGLGNDRVTDVAIDADGNVVIVGFFTGLADLSFDPFTLDIRTASGGFNDRDGFVVKLSADGLPLWLRTFGGQNADEARAVAVNSAGDVYVSGVIGGSADFDPDGAGDNQIGDVSMTMIHSDGSYGWTRMIGGGDVAVGPDGSVFLAMASSVKKLTPDGNIIGTTPVASTVTALAVDATGDVFAARAVSGVTKLSGTEGATIWTQPLLGPATNIAIGDAGSVMIIGSKWISRRSAEDGSPVWSMKIDDPQNRVVLVGVAPEPNGSFFLTGFFYESPDLDFTAGMDRSFISTGAEDVFIDRYECDFPPDDLDGDGLIDDVDSCPTAFNPMQTDSDGDGVADACDNCPAIENPNPADADADGIGDACDSCSSHTIAYWLDASDAVVQRGQSLDCRKTIIRRGTLMPRAMVVDRLNRRLFWTDAGMRSIRSANLDGSDPGEIAVDLGSPAALAVDSVRGRVYWSDLAPARQGIYRINYDGSGRVLLDDSVRARALVVNEPGDQLYWTDMESGKIQQRSTDPQDAQVVDVRTGLTAPHGLAIDNNAGWLFWSDVGTDQILRAPVGGGSSQIVLSDVRNVLGVAIDDINDKLYWTEVNTHRIRRSNLDGSNIEDVALGIKAPVSVGVLPVSAEPIALSGDCDGSGQLDINDLACFVEVLLGTGSPPAGATDRVDTNYDGLVDGRDIDQFVNALLGL